MTTTKPAPEPRALGAVYDRPKVALAIIERVAEGETLRAVVDSDPNHFPTHRTFYAWLAKDPALRELYQAARELSAYSLEEEALEHARMLIRSKPDGDEVRAVAEALKQLRWSAEKRNHTAFGQRPVGQITVPIHIHTSLDMGTGPSQHTEQFPDIYAVELKDPENEEAEEG